MTISIGIMDAITKITQLANVGKSNREMTPRDTAMIRAVATIPRAGCFIQFLLRGKSGVEIIYHRAAP
jgi:hypothetical protein